MTALAPLASDVERVQDNIGIVTLGGMSPKNMERIDAYYASARRIASAYEELVAKQPKWQPISTFHKDGTRFTLFKGDGFHCGYFTFSEWMGEGEIMVRPTHWTEIQLPEDSYAS